MAVGVLQVVIVSNVAASNSSSSSINNLTQALMSPSIDPLLLRCAPLPHEAGATPASKTG